MAPASEFNIYFFVTFAINADILGDFSHWLKQSVQPEDNLADMLIN